MISYKEDTDKSPVAGLLLVFCILFIAASFNGSPGPSDTFSHHEWATEIAHTPALAIAVKSIPLLSGPETGFYLLFHSIPGVYIPKFKTGTDDRKVEQRLLLLRKCRQKIKPSGSYLVWYRHAAEDQDELPVLN